MPSASNSSQKTACRPAKLCGPRSQPSLVRALPPATASASNTTASTPAFFAATAEAMPARPAPTMATSTSGIVLDRLRQRQHGLDGRLGQNAVAEVHDAARVRAAGRLHLVEQLARRRL